jgi:hypothetical protein
VSLGELIANALAPYERNARLAPALLALMPVVALVVGQYGVRPDWSDAAWGLLANVGVFYLFASIAREYGKRQEPKLFRRWGGIPTTQMQRHRNTDLDTTTKARYHAYLARKLGVPYPTAQAELMNSAAADEVYAAGTRWLLNQTRDIDQFPLLFRENVAYGFRRNALGMKWIALAIAFASLLWTLISMGAVTNNGLLLTPLQEGPPLLLAVMFVELSAIAIWAFFITPTTVRTAAFSYADQLLRCCDKLPP